MEQYYSRKGRILKMLIELAGKTIRIDTLYPYIEEYCKDYILKDINEEPDHTISITQEDIDYEREKSEKADKNAGNPIRYFPDDYLETLAVYRRIAEWIPYHDTVLMHGSVVAVDGNGYLFMAGSGTGKSTHTKLWMEYFGDRAVMVNDDKPLVRVCGDRVIAYGTPWDGKHRRSSNISVELAGICGLHRGMDNHIVRTDRKEIYPMLIKQVYRPKDPGSMMATFSLIDNILKYVPVYTLHCNMDISAARVAYEGMKPFSS